MPVSIAAHPSPPRRKRLPAEWVPQQHGAWAMLFVPFFVGVSLRAQAGEWPLFWLPLLPLWVLGYFAFHALSLWLRAKNRARYRRPLQVYGVLSAVLGAVTLALEPRLLGWAAFYAPLLGVALWQARRGDESALLGRVATVLAACLMCVVTVSSGPVQLWQNLSDPLIERAARATLVLSGYFVGTVLYVKTMIRERGDSGFVALSVGFHVLLTLLALLMAGRLGWFTPLFFALATARALLVPLWGRGHKVTPKQVGLGEFGLVLALLVGLTLPM